jgi:hypothetical protein
MKMRLKGQHTYGKVIILSDSPEAQALFTLLKKSSLEPTDLPLVAKMGFEVEVGGLVSELHRNLKEQDIDHTIKKGEINIKARCPSCERELM